MIVGWEVEIREWKKKNEGNEVKKEIIKKKEKKDEE